VLVLAAPDKFRGTVTAREAAAAIAAGAAAAGWACRQLPLADGGEGTLDALGGPNRTTRVRGPLGNPVDAAWRLDGETAILEMARASGLELAGGREENDPVRASTRGTGELIAAAAEQGARTIIVGLGGSATTDGGLGALEALDSLTPFPAHGLDVRVACDVATRFVDAAEVFAPQKGADREQVAALRSRLAALAEDYETRFGIDVQDVLGAGAAGGLAGGLAVAGATLEPGFELVARLVGLDKALAGVHLVVTGEGRLDDTSFSGKVVGGVRDRCATAGIDVLAIVGEVVRGIDPGMKVVSLVERFGLDDAFAATAGCIGRIVTEQLRSGHRTVQG
jgi:glycerate kinase